MKPYVRWIATVGLTTLALVTATSLTRASHHLWNPEVAQAARVTASLLKDSSLRPNFFHRHRQPRSGAPLSLPLSHADLASYTLNQRFSMRPSSSSSEPSEPPLHRNLEPALNSVKIAN
jgi:hypothetical protein